MIATVFLPRTFIVGVFGMNFGWLSELITAPWTFYVFGIAPPVVSSLVVAVYLRGTGGRITRQHDPSRASRTALKGRTEGVLP
ncbi:CorA family divalent cation transporter [Saccharopolyspora sp. ID03-671]|uniref:CorA family divalent cation transporter n=1 Tax=Saccharopolyspora sp. ID03-671 TaxID=3073066 RepID=UPI0032513BE1